MIVLFRPASTALDGAGLALLVVEGKVELDKVGNEYEGESGVDAVVEGTSVIAVQVESVGDVDESEDCVCVLLLRVCVMEME